MKREFITAALVMGATAPSACAQEPHSDAGARAARVARAVGAAPSEGWRTDFSRIAVPVEEIASGGPPRDGIPAIDDPKFVSVDEADRWLQPSEPVLVVEHEGDVRAYPIQILIWHEIVNDRVGGKPLAITFCPLCNTALVFEADVDDRVLDFGTTGRLRHSDLVMYDRQTHSWWQQASGQAIIGELMGTVLEYHPANTLAWDRVKELYGGAIRVLSRQTGHQRRYGENPYVRYDGGPGPMPGFFSAETDRRVPAMERVAAVDIGEGWAARFSDLSEARVAHGQAGDQPVVVFWAPGASSALDARHIARGRDVGQTAAFSPVLDGRALTFEWSKGAYRDAETGSTWDFLGRATDGPLSGSRLEAVPHGNHFWFAWSVFKPDTKLWEP